MASSLSEHLGSFQTNSAAPGERVGVFVAARGNIVALGRVARDPGDPHRVGPAYDSGDRLYPNTAAYRAIAAAIALRDIR